MSFSSNSGSLDSLNVLTGCGLRPRPDQIRWTVAGETPTCLAIDRQLQCVSPEGFSCWVRRTISSTLAAVTPGLRPRPSRTWPNFDSPSSANLPRHERTVTGVTPTLAAILELATPSAAINNTVARFTSRCAAVEDRGEPQRKHDPRRHLTNIGASNGLLRDYFRRDRISASKQNASPRSTMHSTTVHAITLVWQSPSVARRSYSRNVRRPLLRCSLEFARR